MAAVVAESSDLLSQLSIRWPTRRDPGDRRPRLLRGTKAITFLSCRLWALQHLSLCGPLRIPRKMGNLPEISRTGNKAKIMPSPASFYVGTTSCRNAGNSLRTLIVTSVHPRNRRKSTHNRLTLPVARSRKQNQPMDSGPDAGSRQARPGGAHN